MIQFILALVVLAACGLGGTIIGGMYPDTFHPHAWLGPCAIAKRLGPTGSTNATTFPDNLGWRIVDADTLICENRQVRIVGYDAPEAEPSRAQCAEEALRGKAARDRVVELLRRQTWSASTVGVPVGPDSEGRHRVRVFIGNTDLKDILTQDRLARAWRGRGQKPNWCSSSN
ncbi:MAG: hypothetical protein AAGC70_00100 [Pseudomonadota bacterium]